MNLADLWPFSRKSGDPAGEGNRFYQEQLTERFISGREKQLKVTAALAAGLRIAEGVSSLPITVGELTHDRLGRTIKTPIREGELWDRLCGRDGPNEWMTPVEFVETLTMWAVFRGVGRAYIHRGYKGRIRALIPMEDGAVFVRKDLPTGSENGGAKFVHGSGCMMRLRAV